MGLLVGHSMLIPSADHSQSLWVLVGMGSLLAATTHAPAMSAIMMFEMTRSYNVVLAAMPACVIASVLGSFLRRKSVYTESLGLSVGMHATPTPSEHAFPGNNPVSCGQCDNDTGNTESKPDPAFLNNSK
jgi:CIC family chloride channel protein